MTILAKVRKCSICKKEIDRENQRMLKQSGGYSHYDCYVSKRKMVANPNITKIMQSANEFEQKAIEYEMGLMEKDDLFQYLMEQYNVTILPQYFFVRMNAYFKGEAQGMSRGIPPVDLLDMWKRQQSYLDRIHHQNETHGKPFTDAMHMINFDLKVLINKYDSYLKWKKKEIAVGNYIEKTQENIISQQTSVEVFRQAKINAKYGYKKKQTELNNILDEI